MTREEAVSLIEERIHVTEYVESSYVDCVDIEALRIAIKALKQPEQKKGEWLEHYAHEDGERDGVWCSECREHYYFGGQLMNFCPNCGADMRGEKDG